MGASNHPGLRFAKGRARAIEAELDERAAGTHEDEVYRQVDARDKRRCTCCGRSGNPHARTLLDKLHHDHILERSLGGPTETWNVALLCALCHAFKGSHELEPAGNPDIVTLRYTVTAKAAKVIFKGRTRPAHVRLGKGQ